MHVQRAKASGEDTELGLLPAIYLAAQPERRRKPHTYAPLRITSAPRMLMFMVRVEESGGAND